jgi:hypothetical protein
MRIVGLLLVLVGCGASQEPVANGVDRGWFCLRASDLNSGMETSACFRSRDDCSSSHTGRWQLTQMCAPQPLAYCIQGDHGRYGAVSSCFATPEHCSMAIGAPESCIGEN